MNSERLGLRLVYAETFALAAWPQAAEDAATAPANLSGAARHANLAAPPVAFTTSMTQLADLQEL